MSISNTLRKAAKLQEKIDRLRGQLTGILDKARAEIASSPKDEFAAVLRRRAQPKMLKVSARKVKGATRRGRPSTLPKSNRRAEAATVTKSRARSPLAGRKRSASPSGPLAPAVVKVLQSNGKAMNVRDILDRLTSGGYKFNSPEPKKNLAARIYRLKGVKQVGAGMFGLV